MDGKYTMMQLGDDICADLDLAMLTRRDGAPGSDVPEGILTKYKGTAFDEIIRDIDKLEHPATINLGFMLLTLSGDTIEMINDGISQLSKIGKSDGKHHDLTLAMSEGEAGLTIHCNDDHISESGPRLENHCTRRKYSLKAQVWCGICIDTKSARVRFGVSDDYAWEQSDEMDKIVKDLPKPQNLKGKKKINFNSTIRAGNKTGRNAKCPCGSGKKYKKCCLA